MSINTSLHRPETQGACTVCSGNKEAKFWLEPEVELAKNSGIPEHKLSEIRKIVEKYADEFKKQFRELIGMRVDD